MARRTFHLQLFGVVIIAALHGCAHAVPPPANTPAEIAYGKLLVYGDVLRRDLPLHWRQHYTAIFLEGTPAEQLIFRREFRRHNFPVEDIRSRVPFLYSKDSDVNTGGAALHFSARLLESPPGVMEFDVTGSGLIGENRATVQRAGTEWTLGEWKHKNYSVIP